MKFQITPDKQFLRLSEWEDDKQIRQLKLSFTKKVRNYFFKMKKFKKFGWDGSISFMDKYNRIPIGLWARLYDICKDSNYECEIEDFDSIIDVNFDREKFNQWVEEFFKDAKVKPRDYQIEAAIEILKWKRSISEIATSAGKTLIMYMVFAYLKTQGLLTRMLVIVPNIQLVLQTSQKFEEYSEDYKFLKFKTQLIGGGEDKKKKDVDVIFGTYQTLCTLDKEFFEEVSVVCGDESHTSQSLSVSKTLMKTVNATIRFGLSGTTRALDDTAESYTMQGLLGPVVNKISADYLFKQKHATPVKVRMIYLNYLDADKRVGLSMLKGKNMDPTKILGIERELITSSETRLNYITKMIAKTTKNSLVLFSDIKRGYGKNIFNRLKELMDNSVDIFYVDGHVDKENRDYYRKQMNLENKQRILVASFGTLSQGIDINNIHNIFFVESYKSEVIVKQSIGRGMRLANEKDFIEIIDFVDDYSTKGYKNYIMKQSKEREQIYNDEKYIVKKYYVDF